MVLTPSEKVSQTWDTFARNIDGSKKPMRKTQGAFASLLVLSLCPRSGCPWPFIPSELTEYLQVRELAVRANRRRIDGAERVRAISGAGRERKKEVSENAQAATRAFGSHNGRLAGAPASERMDHLRSFQSAL